MASTFDLETLNIPEIVEGITAFVVAPVVFPVAAAVKQPVVQAAIKEGIALSERCKEAVAEAGEVIENLAAEVNTDLIKQKQGQFSSQTAQNYSTNGKSEVAKDLMHVVSDVNADVARITNGFVDLRLLLPLGLSALAIRQLVTKGLQIDEIPWYTLTWYAFDTFLKFNDGDQS
ncbi:DUF5132 domain-containing protein [Tolypothrix campylonemoides VB511288]|nr:DUF5132 domain-containing protein [Tolypothrix campylonemoides VB511288]